jgi:hypothetical protein
VVAVAEAVVAVVATAGVEVWMRSLLSPHQSRRRNQRRHRKQRHQNQSRLSRSKPCGTVYSFTLPLFFCLWLHLFPPHNWVWA